jgi:protein-S-isoprenylcysteine O-methyltransferase Ste14
MAKAICIYTLTFIWLAGEVFVFRRDAPGGGVRQDSSSRAWLFLCIGLGVIVALYATSHRVAPVPTVWQPWGVAGALTFLAGMILRFRAVRWLGDYFRTQVTILSDHRLIEDGPYARVRHPAYTDTFLSCVGIGLACADWVAIMAMVTLPLLALAYRIRVEERVLGRAFGPQWTAYRARTGALFPRLG